MARRCSSTRQAARFIVIYTNRRGEDACWQFAVTPSGAPVPAVHKTNIPQRYWLLQSFFASRSSPTGEISGSNLIRFWGVREQNEGSEAEKQCGLRESIIDDGAGDRPTTDRIFERIFSKSSRSNPIG